MKCNTHSIIQTITDMLEKLNPDHVRKVLIVTTTFLEIERESNA